MPVYLIIDVAVIDPDLYGEYVEQVPAVVERYGGRYLARGGDVVPLTADWHPQRIILIEFDSIDQVRDCFTSPEFLALAPLRKESTTSRAIIVEGCELL
ncbi:MAG: DUF1330 domain-containing protein [Desulfobaccales bacterium]